MFRHVLVLSLALLSLPAAAQTVPADTAGEALLRSARLWEIKGRPDLQRLALEKYLLAHPGDAQAARALGQLEIRSARFEAVDQLIARLRADDPDSAAARDLEQARRIATRDRLQMATINRLLQTDRYDEAVAALRALFPDGAPGGEAGLEYYRIIDSAPAGRAEAGRGLRQLLAQNPDDPQYVLALANHLTRSSATREEGLRRIAEMQLREDANPQRVRETWRAGLSRLPEDSAAVLPRLRDYLKLFPDDSDIAAQLARTEAALERQRRIERDPGYRHLRAGTAALDAGRVDAAERELKLAQALRPGDARIVGELGRLRMRQGRHAEALPLLRLAVRGDADNRGKWRSLEATARYWSHLARADAATDAGDLDVAGTELRAALALQPRNAEGLSAMAAHERLRGDNKAAERRYREALRHEPGHPGALRGLARLLAQTGREREALALIEKQKARAPQLREEFGRVRAGLMREQAEAALAAGRTGEALRGLEAAQTADPDDPWTRFSLAQLYRRLGLPKPARELMQQGVERAPQSADARYAYALLLSALDDDAAAAQQIEQIPPAQRSEGMRALQSRLQVAGLRREARRAQRESRREDAVQRLQEAESVAGADLGLRESVGDGWIDIGEPQRALALLRPADDAGVPARMAWARVLDRTRQDAELEQEIARLRGRDDLGAEDRARLDGWEIASALREAETLADRNRLREALARLASARRAHPQDLDLLEAEARLLAATGEEERAVALYRARLAEGEDWTLRLGLLRLLHDIGRRADARAEQARVAEGATTPERQLAYARQLLRMKRIDDARAQAALLLEQQPDDADTLRLAGQIESADGHYGRAHDYFSRARSADDLDALEQRRYGYITVGLNAFGKSGSAGRSEYGARELAIELRVPQGYGGHWFALVDPVQVESGTLPAVYDEAALYGQVQANGPGSLAAFPNGAEQSADGVAVGLGYETDDLRIDLGTTPLGFPVEDVVGGIRYDGELGDLDWRLDLSRRPVTSSLLSYAGARDPVTGEIWGGVRSTGLDARLAHYGARRSVSGSLGYHRLTGRNVPGNDFLSARGGIDWRVLDVPNHRAYAGLSLTFWSYAQNLGEYTFGHGGYYSPQSYVSLGVPLEITGRWNRWAYQLRGSGSVSYSVVDAAPFYPGDAALQAAAGGMPLPAGFSAPVYDASSGAGTGFSLKGALEYEITKKWFVGGHLDIDRSAFYAPNFMQLYLRYDFAPQRGPIRFPPQPPRSYSRF